MAKSPDARPQTMADILSVIQTLIEQGLDGGKAEIDEPVIVEKESYQSTVSDRRRTLGTARVPSIPNPQQRFWSIEDAGWNVAWPKNKPIADIVFPQLLKTEKEEAVALWVMLPRSEVSQRLLNTRYNQFLCTIHPHPMVLWITTIYDPMSGPKWLPCYLDLKDARGEKRCNCSARLAITHSFSSPERILNNPLTFVPSRLLLIRSKSFKIGCALVEGLLYRVQP